MTFQRTEGMISVFQSNSFNQMKRLAIKYNIAIQWDFSTTGAGKGLVDGLGGVFVRGYNDECVRKLTNFSKKIFHNLEFFDKF